MIYLLILWNIKDVLPFYMTVKASFQVVEMIFDRNGGIGLQILQKQ